MRDSRGCCRHSVGMEPCVFLLFDTRIVDRKAKRWCPLQAPNGSWHSLAAEPSLLAPPGTILRVPCHTGSGSCEGWLLARVSRGCANVLGRLCPGQAVPRRGCAQDRLCPRQAVPGHTESPVGLTGSPRSPAQSQSSSLFWVAPSAWQPKALVEMQKWMVVIYWNIRGN